MTAAVRLRWKFDGAGYELETRGTLGRGDHEDANKYIVARGGEAEHYWLEGTDARVYEELANTPITPSGALKFANKRGLLFRDRHDEMSLSDFYHSVHFIETMLVLARQRNYKGILANIPRDDDELKTPSGIGLFTMDVSLVPGADLPRVFIRAQSLMSFALMELMQVVASAAEIRTCGSLHCRNFFTISPDAKRRSSRQYCSDRCRVAQSRARAKEDIIMMSQPRSAMRPLSPPKPQLALPPRRRRQPKADEDR